jgi:hypothetical protein
VLFLFEKERLKREAEEQGNKSGEPGKKPAARNLTAKQRLRLEKVKQIFFLLVRNSNLFAQNYVHKNLGREHSKRNIYLWENSRKVFLFFENQSYLS